MNKEDHHFRYGQDVGREQVGFEEVRARAAEFAACVARNPELWRIGDGFGGWVQDQIREALELEGFEVAPPRVERRFERRPISRTVIKHVMERDEYRCRSCGTHLDLTIDHIVPVARGGSDDEDNLQTLCRPCNSAKGTRMP